MIDDRIAHPRNSTSWIGHGQVNGTGRGSARAARPRRADHVVWPICRRASKLRERYGKTCECGKAKAESRSGASSSCKGTSSVWDEPRANRCRVGLQNNRYADESPAAGIAEFGASRASHWPRRRKRGQIQSRGDDPNCKAWKRRRIRSEHPGGATSQNSPSSRYFPATRVPHPCGTRDV